MAFSLTETATATAPCTHFCARTPGTALPRFRRPSKPHTPVPRKQVRGRRYDKPELGRWCSRDPMEEGGGITLYAYCENDPCNLQDGLGLTSTEIGILDAALYPRGLGVGVTLNGSKSSEDCCDENGNLVKTKNNDQPPQKNNQRGRISTSDSAEIVGGYSGPSAPGTYRCRALFASRNERFRANGTARRHETSGGGMGYVGTKFPA